MSSFSVEPAGTSEDVPCECCGDTSRTARGYVRGQGGETAYVANWTVGKVAEHGAHLDLLMPTSRGFIGLSIEFRTTEDGPGFMVTDAGERQTWKKFPEAVLLSRTEVVGTPLATTAFEILDAIWLQDDRLRELRGSAA